MRHKVIKRVRRVKQGKPAARVYKPGARQIAFVERLLEGDSRATAARAAGFHKDAGYKGRWKPGGKVEQTLELAGITVSRLTEVLNRGLEAHEVIVAKHQGAITDTLDVPDFSNRHRYMETGLRLLGLGANVAGKKEVLDSIDAELDDIERREAG